MTGGSKQLRNAIKGFPYRGDECKHVAASYRNLRGIY
jgi:hypothetical protein